MSSTQQARPYMSRSVTQTISFSREESSFSIEESLLLKNFHFVIEESSFSIEESSLLKNILDVLRISIEKAAL